MVEIHGPISIPSIGEQVTLKCTAAVLHGVIESPVLALKHPNGTTLSSDAATEISVVLDPVHIADAGEYTCSGEIIFSELENVTVTAVEIKQNLSLKCKFRVPHT